MNKATTAAKICFVSTILLGTVTIGAARQENVVSQESILSAKVSHLDWEKTTLQQGLQKLASGPVPFAYGIENPLKLKFKDPPIPDPLISLQLDGKTIREILDALCQADARYTWSVDGTTINVYPRDSVADSSYLPNRILKVLRLEGITQIDQGLLAIAKQLPPPAEQVAHVQTGGSNDYPPEPWTAVFNNLTVRQALNRISAHMGPHGTWVFYGSQEFREFAFFEGVAPHQGPSAFAKMQRGVVPIESNLTLQTAEFTTTVSNGKATFTADVTIGQVPATALPIVFKVRRLVASNPSNVGLDDPSDLEDSKQCTISEEDGTCSVSFFVASSPSNAQAGSVSWEFLYNSTSRDAVFNTTPNPLNGIVSFAPSEGTSHE